MSFLRRASLALGGLLLALLLAELLLRATGVGAPAPPSPFGPIGDVVQADVELGWKPRPGITLLDSYRLNARGHRGPDVPDQPAPGTLRLLAVGDSTTFGLGVAEEQRWSDVLQRLLAALLDGVRDVEVCNVAVPGYTSLQNLVQLQRELPVLQPDIVLLHVTGHNDFNSTTGRTDAEQLAFAHSLAGWWDGLALARATGLGIAAPSGAQRLRVPPAELEANLHAAAGLVRAAGARLVFVISGRSASALEHAPLQAEVDGIIQRVAAQEQVPVADARPGFQSLLPRDDFPDSIHPDPDGHRVIAWAAFAALVGPAGPLADEPRAAFGRAWVGARDGGVPAQRAGLLAPEAPPGFATLRDALAAPDLDARLAADEASLPAAVRELDPLLGRRRPGCLESRARLQLAGQLPAEADPATLLAIAQRCADFHRPRDPLVALLGGPDAVATATPEDLALARAAWILQASLGALVLPRDTCLDTGAQALRADDPLRAASLAQAVLSFDPDNAQALLLHGRALDRLGRHDDAEAAYTRAAQLEPDSATGQYLLGRAAHRRGDQPEEEACLRRAIALDPLLDVARHDLGVLLLAAGRLDEAELQLRVTQALRGGGFADLDDLLAELARRRGGG